MLGCFHVCVSSKITKLWLDCVEHARLFSCGLAESTTTRCDYSTATSSAPPATVFA